MFVFQRMIMGLVIAACVTSCQPPVEIKNHKLRDRVIACGAGFSENLVTSLDATYQANANNGKLTGEFKEGARTLILKEIPDKDRLKAYEDYIRCIETKMY